MNETVARYEFRIFAPQMGTTEHLLRRLAPCKSITEDTEIYLLNCNSAGELNVKIRQGRLDLKRLVRRHHGLEQWKPDGQYEFPVSGDRFGALLVGQPNDIARARSSELFSLEEFLQVVDEPLSQLQRVNVTKRRCHFALPRCSAEHDYLLINGAAVESVAMESEYPVAVLELQSSLKLEGFENQSYPVMLCRLLGRLPIPEENSYGH